MSDLKEHFTKLVAHLEWADRKVLESLRSAPHAPGKAREIYSHILGSEHVWLSRIEGAPPQFAVWPNLGLDECQRLAAENVDRFKKVVAGLTNESLRAGITYRNSAGDQFTSTLEDILTHATMHGSYHRAQVAMLMRQSGETPTPTDYIAFARGSPAATRR